MDAKVGSENENEGAPPVLACMKGIVASATSLLGAIPSFFAVPVVSKSTAHCLLSRRKRSCALTMKDSSCSLLE